MNKIIIMGLLITLVISIVACKDLFSDSRSDTNDVFDLSTIKIYEIPDIETIADEYLNENFSFIIQARTDESAINADSIITFPKDGERLFFPVFTAIVSCSMYNAYVNSNQEYIWYNAP